MPGQEKWEEGQWSMVARLLDLVQRHVGAEADCTLVADRGLASFALVTLCQERGWHSLLRISGEHTFQQQGRQGWSDWKAVSSLVEQPGQHWYGSAIDLALTEQIVEIKVFSVWGGSGFLSSSGMLGIQRVCKRNRQWIFPLHF